MKREELLDRLNGQIASARAYRTILNRSNVIEALQLIHDILKTDQSREVVKIDISKSKKVQEAIDLIKSDPAVLAELKESLKETEVS